MGVVVERRQRIRIGDRVFWLCAGVALLLGMGNPYNLGMWLQLLCLGMGLRFLLRRCTADLAVGGMMMAVTALGFLAVNANTLCYQMAHGGNELAVARSYHQLELYALKPIEFILPPWCHRVTWLTDISRKYAMTAWVKGEMFSPYLGVVGLSALIWLVAEFGLHVLNLRKFPRRPPSYAPLCLWVILYSIIGGTNCFLGLFGMMYFRGGNRYSIFISAIVLFFLVSRMSRLVRRWNRPASYALAAVVAGIGLLDQLPPPSTENTQTWARAVQNDQQFGRVLEEKLPPGAMIFQLPLMNFIDANPIRECTPYQHVRPYLWTKHLRFSFGSVQGRTREDWQAQVVRLPLAQTVKELERYGFAGLYFNRTAYEDRGEGMLKELAKCGKSQLIEDEARDLVCVVLNPSPQPAWPHSDDAAQIVFTGNWEIGQFTLPAQGITNELGHWASSSKSSLYFMNESPEGRDFHLAGLLMTETARRVDVEFQGRVIWSGQFEADQVAPLDLRLYARPGRNFLYFKSDNKPEPQHGKPQGIRVTHAIVGLQIVKDPPSQP